jgi:hypothetical protein
MAPINGARIVWAPPPPRLESLSPSSPTCPKRCDVATPPEHFGGDQYVCVCCGTQFTWKGSPDGHS